MPSNEVLASAAFFIVSMLAYAWGYRKNQPAHADPVLSGIGMELGNREQTERLIAQVTRIADGIDVLADKRTDEMEAMHKALLERLDAQERRQPRRRP